MHNNTCKALVITVVVGFALWLVFAFDWSQPKSGAGVIAQPVAQPFAQPFAQAPKKVIQDQGITHVQQQDIQLEETIWSMKNVPVTTSLADLQRLKEGGIDVVTTEWGLSSDAQDIESFMVQTQNVGLQVVMDGGFSPAAWGYDASYDGGLQEPQWQGETVRNWIEKIKRYPNVYAYDISNEFGENLPVPQQDITDDVLWREKYAIAKEQLRIVRDDVRKIDDSKPLLLRLRQWDINNDLFVLENHFEKDLVDIVMLNLYTNWVWNGYNPDKDLMIQQKAQIYIDAIREIDPDVKIWISVAAFADEPYFRRPSPEHIARDVQNTHKLTDIQGIAFFGLGYENAPSWYLFENGVDLWDQITQIIADE